MLPDMFTNTYSGSNYMMGFICNQAGVEEVFGNIPEGVHRPQLFFPRQRSVTAYASNSLLHPHASGMQSEAFTT